MNYRYLLVHIEDRIGTITIMMQPMPRISGWTSRLRGGGAAWRTDVYLPIVHLITFCLHPQPHCGLPARSCNSLYSGTNSR